MIRDRHGREIRGLRISVTSRCNLNCFYCHAEGQRTSSIEMTPEEIGEIARIAAELGVRDVKITGGEPLLREDICEIVREVSRFGFEDISLTTNGIFLADVAAQLRDAGLRRVNVSLDTLDPDVYERITGHRELLRVLEGIDGAAVVGLMPIKINMVLLAGINEDHVDAVMNYAFERGAILQIIEYVCAGKACDPSYRADVKVVEKAMEGRAVRVMTRDGMQMRKKYVLPGGEVEIVRPVHNSEFCARCTRLRITSDGNIKPCLMREGRLHDIVSQIKAGNREGATKTFLGAIADREPFWKEAQHTGG